MPDPYYEYGATVRLRRHVALVGGCTEDTRSVAHRLAALGGLPLADLERKIEHYAGQSIWELVQSEGAARYRQLESEALQRALADSPPGIVALGDGALLDESNQRRVSAVADLVLLQLDLPNLYWRLLRNRRDGDSTSWHPLYPQALTSLDQLRPFFEERKPGFAAAKIQFPVRGKHPNVIAKGLLERLSSLAGESEVLPQDLR